MTQTTFSRGSAGVRFGLDDELGADAVSSTLLLFNGGRSWLELEGVLGSASGFLGLDFTASILLPRRMTAFCFAVGGATGDTGLLLPRGLSALLGSAEALSPEGLCSPAGQLALGQAKAWRGPRQIVHWCDLEALHFPCAFCDPHLSALYSLQISIPFRL